MIFFLSSQKSLKISYLFYLFLKMSESWNISLRNKLLPWICVWRLKNVVILALIRRDPVRNQRTPFVDHIRSVLMSSVPRNDPQVIRRSLLDSHNIPILSPFRDFAVVAFDVVEVREEAIGVVKVRIFAEVNFLADCQQHSSNNVEKYEEVV